MEDRLLREYVQKLLAEMDFGGIGYGSYSYGDPGMGGMGGVGGWGGQNLAGVFLSPFLDVGKTAIGVGKEVGTVAKGIARTGIEGMLSMILPFVSGEYEKIAKETHEELGKVKKQYEGLYKKNLDAIFNTDLVTLAFMANPVAVITGLAFDKVLYAAPDAGLSVLGWFVPVTGQKRWQSLMNKLSPERLQRVLRTAAGEDSKTKLIVWDDRNRRKLYASVRRAMGIEADPNDPNSSGPIEGSDRAGQLVNEEAGAEQTYQDVVKGILKDPAVMQALTKSEQAQKLRTMAKNLVAKKLSRTVELASKIAEQPTIEALGKLVGQDMKGGENDLMKVKEQVRDRLAKSLSAELQSLGKAGIDPAKSGLQNPYEEAIKQINNLPLNNAPQQGNVSPRGNANGKEDRSGADGSGAAGRAQGAQGADRGVPQQAQSHRDGN